MKTILNLNTAKQDRCFSENINWYLGSYYVLSLISNMALTVLFCADQLFFRTSCSAWLVRPYTESEANVTRPPLWSRRSRDRQASPTTWQTNWPITWQTTWLITWQVTWQKTWQTTWQNTRQAVWQPTPRYRKTWQFSITAIMS